MKTLCVLSSLLVLHVPALAAVKIPKGVFVIGQYEEALKAAKAQKKPLAIVNLDEAAEGKAAEETADDAFKSVTGSAVVIFVSTLRGGDQLYELPPSFITAVQDLGQHYAPMVMLCAPSEDVVWKIITPSGQKVTPKEFKQTLRSGVAEAKPAIMAYFSAKTPPAFVPPGEKALFWPYKTGEKGVKGAFAKVEGEQLFLKTEKGEIGAPIELKDLRAGSVRYAKMLANGGAAPAAEAVPASEKWTNSKGKEIEASFVKLADGKVTLRLTTGKDYTLALTELSAASQARAKELAAKAGK